MILILFQISVSLENTAPINEVDQNIREAYLIFYNHYSVKLDREKEVVKVWLFITILSLIKETNLV